MVVLKKIRSYVRREGRMTPGQQQSLTQHFAQFGVRFPPQADWLNCFANVAPLVVDIGYGSGESVAFLSQQHPDWNIVGIEVYRPGVGHLLRHLAEHQISNVRVFCHDAVEVMEKAFLPFSVNRIQIFFPDPWPKKRHHKRRLLQPAFVKQLAHCLCAGGELVLATDWQDYAEHMMLVLSAEPLLRNAVGSGLFSERDPLRPLTKFERKGHSAGHQVWDLHFVAVHSNAT